MVIEVDCDEVHKSLMAVLLISFLAAEETEGKRINAGWQKLTSIFVIYGAIIVVRQKLKNTGISD